MPRLSAKPLLNPLQNRDIRPVWMNGRATSISVEPRIWDYFCIIAAERGVTIGQLLSHVDRAMRLEPTWRGKCSTRNLSSAVRVFVIEQCELEPQPRPNPHLNWAT